VARDGGCRGLLRQSRAGQGEGTGQRESDDTVGSEAHARPDAAGCYHASVFFAASMRALFSS
jgi:hypothetical protein